MRIKIIRAIRKPPWLKLWSAITGVALVVALVLTFLPYEASIDTDGILSISLRQASANPGIGEFQYKKKLTFNTTAISITTNQTNFPVCVHINSSSWTNSTERDNFFGAWNVGGKRCQFFDANGTTNLDYEVELYNSATPEAIYWVEVPQVDGDSSADYIWCAFGNDPNGTDQDNKTGVWDSNFKFVNHMANTNLEAYKTADGVYTPGADQGYLCGEPVVLYLNGKFNCWFDYREWSGEVYLCHVAYMYSADGKTSWSAPVQVLEDYTYQRIFYNTDDSKYWLYAAYFPAGVEAGEIHLWTSSSPDSGFSDQGLVLSHGTSGAWDYSSISKLTTWRELDDTTTDLTTSMDNSTTEMDVGDTTKFAANQYIKVEDEFMLVTAIVNSTHCHVTRGQLGTSAAAHTQPKDVYKRTWYGIYNGGNGATHKGGSGFATSYDGKTWTKYLPNNANPCMPCPEFSITSGIGSHMSISDVPQLGSDGCLYAWGFGRPDSFVAAGVNDFIPTESYIFKSQSTGTTQDKLAGNWSAVGGCANPWIARTLTWEGPGLTTSQTGDPWTLEQGGNLYIYYTGYRLQNPDATHPDILGLVYVANETMLGLIADTPGSMNDSTGLYNPDGQNMMTALATGKVGGARNLGGAESIRLNNTIALTPTAATISMWVNINTAPSSGVQYALVASRPAGGNAGYGLTYYNNSGTYQLYLVFWGGFTGYINYTLTPGTWFYITGVFSSNTPTIYINGVAQSTTASGSGYTAASAKVRLGSWDYDAITYIKGILDEVEISNTVRTADWIKLEYYSMQKTNFNGDGWLSWGTQETALPAITNTPSSWAIGVVAPNTVVYFSATGVQDDDYGLITNTGGCAVDIQIQGQNIEGGSYDWVLASSAGSEQYSLYANSEATPTVYDIEVKSSSYNNLCTDLAEDDTYNWSMKFIAPTAFHANDDGNQKTCTVTLVASEAS